MRNSIRLLVTGIHGFIGRNLINGLKDSYSYYGLDIISRATERIVKTYNWDSTDSIPQVDVIIHLAGLAHDTKNSIDSKKYFEVNVGLTKRIFDYYLKSKAVKFIFFSSVKAVADSVYDDALTEEFVPDPQTPYGRSKLEAENYILGQNLPEGKKVYILRPCMIHGPGNKGNLNLLYKFIKLGLPYPLGAFDNKRSFTSIANLNFILEQIIEGDIPPGIYQVADDDALSTHEVVAQMAKTLGRKSRILRINKRLIKNVAKLGDRFNLPFNSERLMKLTENYVVSNAKLKKVLGIEYLPVTAREGVTNTINSFTKSII